MSKAGSDPGMVRLADQRFRPPEAQQNYRAYRARVSVLGKWL